MSDSARSHLAWLIWCYQQGYTNAEDRAIITSWMDDPESEVHPDDVKLRRHLLAMADEVLAILERPAAETDVFVLDRVENPHPRMLAEGIEARRRARAIGGKEATYYWAGFIACMAAATGETPEALNAWIDRHTGDSCSMVQRPEWSYGARKK